MPDLGEIILKNEYPLNGNTKTIKVISWNIHRGFKLEGIIAYIKSENPDIILIQEADWGNQRTNNENITECIAKSLNFNYAFSADYKSLDKKNKGIIGNSIISRYTIKNPTVLNLPMDHLYKGIIPTRTTIRRIFKPVKGSAIALSCEIDINGENVTAYSTHLEISWASLKTRMNQFEYIYNDSKKKSHLIIAGDMNTAAHGAFGIYNILENNDAYKLKNIFTPEAVFWEEKFIQNKDLIDPFDKRKDWTLKIWPIYKAKLDWILTRGFEHKSSYTGPLGYSDHKPLISNLSIK